MLQVVMTFLAVAAVIYLSYLFSRAVGRGLNRGGGGSAYMRLVDQIVLGQDRHMAIVEVSGEYFLIGITSGQISLLSKLDGESLKELSGSEKGEQKFSDILKAELKGYLGRGGKKR